MNVEEESPLRIEGGLTIENVASLRVLLLDRLAGPAPLAVDWIAVTACDTAGLQLLCAAQRSARAAGRSWRFYNPPQALFDACREAGLSTEEVGR